MSRAEGGDRGTGLEKTGGTTCIVAEFIKKSEPRTTDSPSLNRMIGTSDMQQQSQGGLRGGGKGQEGGEEREIQY